MEGILVPLGAFVLVAALVITPRYFRSRERQKMADTLKAAIEAGQTLPPDIAQLMAVETKPPPSPQRDLRRGLILLAIALALAFFGTLLGFGGEPDAFYPMIGASAFPGFIGLALIGMYFANRDRG